MERQYLVLFAICIFVVSQVASASTNYELDKTKSQLEFVAATTRFEVIGTFSNWDISATSKGEKLTDIEIEAIVNTANFDTKDEKRDKHLKTDDFFAVDRYPQATFKSREIKDMGNGSFLVEGQLIFKGNKKGVRFQAKLEGNRVWGEIDLNRQDFGISYTPNFIVSIFSGAIKDQVKVRFDLYVVKRVTEGSPSR